jgi:hypothetical protein
VASVLQKAAYLAEFHFKCERNGKGQTNYDWGYWFWILKVLLIASSLLPYFRHRDTHPPTKGSTSTSSILCRHT